MIYSKKSPKTLKNTLTNTKKNEISARYNNKTKDELIELLNYQNGIVSRLTPNTAFCNIMTYELNFIKALINSK